MIIYDREEKCQEQRLCIIGNARLSGEDENARNGEEAG